MRDRIPGLRRLLQLPLTTARRARADVDDEIAFHLEARARDLVAEGLAPTAAEERARLEFGDVEAARRLLAAAQVRRAGWRRVAQFLAEARGDARHALRGLVRAPAFTIVVVLTLALGIGANVTILGLVDRLLLRPPGGVADPDRLVRVYGRNGWTALTRSWPDYVDLRDGARTLRAVAAYRGADATMRLPARVVVRVERATASYLPMLGVRPVRGRLFTPDEDGASPAPVVVIGDRLWREELGASPAAVGSRVRIDGRPHTIVGIAPRDFAGLDLAPAEAWVPLGALRSDRGNYGAVHVVARLADDASLVAADRDANRANRAGYVADGLVADEDKMQLGAVQPTRGPMAPREVRVARWLAGVTLLVLLATVANVAHLLLARGLARARDTAVRAALGAGAGRLARRGLVEGVLLGALGGLASTMLALWAAPLVGRYLMADLPSAALARLVDARTLMLAGMLTLLVGTGCGIVMVLQAARHDVAAVLRGGALVTGPRRRGLLRGGLLVAQVASTVVLLVGAGLFVRSLRTVRALPLGFDADGLVVLRMDGAEVPLDDSARARLVAAALPRVRGTAGVRAASAAHSVPFTSSWRTRFHVPGRDPERWGRDGGGRYNFLSTFVDAAYLEATGVPLLAGRWLTPGDLGGDRVAVVNERLARTVWPAESPASAVGRCIRVVSPEAPCTRIVGVVGDTRVESVFDAAPEQYYMPLAQAPRGELAFAVVARVSGSPARAAEAMRRDLQARVPEGIDVVASPLSAAIDPVRRPWELGAVAFSTLGVLVLLVAGAGIYGIAALMVRERTRELGVRRALGARAADVARLVGARVLVVLGIGVLLGLAAGAVAARAGTALLYGVRPLDPVSYALAASVLVVAAVLACVGPVRRAVAVEPTTVLRDGG